MRPGLRASPVCLDSYDVYNECVFGYILRSDVVITAKQEDDLGWGGGGSEIETEFEGVDFALAAVEHVEAVPSVLWVDELVGGGDGAGSGEHAVAVVSGKSIPAHDHQREFGVFQVLGGCMFPGSDVGEH